MAEVSLAHMNQVMAVTECDPEALRAMNAQMRRIDLLCKLFGPLAIALLNAYSTEVAIIVNFAMNVLSIVLEYFAIARVYYDAPSLQKPKAEPDPELPEAEPSRTCCSAARTSWKSFLAIIRKSAQDFHFYFQHRTFLPSIAGAILYLTVLSFGGQMVTYLLLAGYNSNQIGVARTLSVAFEVLATWTTPWLMERVGALRAGLWMSSWQVATLAAGISIFWAFQSSPFISASGLVGGTILSRLGLRGFDLCIQLIVQEVRSGLSHFPPEPILLIASPGSRSRETRSIFLRRSRLAKCLRAALLLIYHYLLPPRAIQVALAHFCGGRRLGSRSIYGFCLLAQRAYAAFGETGKPLGCR